MSDKQRLLIVEDDPNLSELLSEYFGRQGFQVETADWGEDAVKLCLDDPPHLALLDINLPDIDGFEVARRLHARRRTQHLPLIFLTTRDTRPERLRGLELGAVDYVTKPFDLQELHLRVSNALQRAIQQADYNAITHLPQGRLVDERLGGLLQSKDWAVVIAVLHNLDHFRGAYGFVAADDALSAVARLLRDAAGQLDARLDFIGHLKEDTFIALTRAAYLPHLLDTFRAHFIQKLDHFYPQLEPMPSGHRLQLSASALSAPDGGFRNVEALRQALLHAGSH